jgi:hypothetical protein
MDSQKPKNTQVRDSKSRSYTATTVVIAAFCDFNKSGLAETAKGAGPFQRTEVRQRDTRWQHAKQNGHVRMYAPLFRLARALHANEIARFRMDTQPSFKIASTFRVHERHKGP